VSSDPRCSLHTAPPPLFGRRCRFHDLREAQIALISKPRQVKPVSMKQAEFLSDELEGQNKRLHFVDTVGGSNERPSPR